MDDSTNRVRLRSFGLFEDFTAGQRYTAALGVAVVVALLGFGLPDGEAGSPAASVFTPVEPGGSSEPVVEPEEPATVGEDSDPTDTGFDGEPDLDAGPGDLPPLDLDAPGVAAEPDPGSEQPTPSDPGPHPSPSPPPPSSPPPRDAPPPESPPDDGSPLEEIVPVPVPVGLAR